MTRKIWFFDELWNVFIKNLKLELSINAIATITSVSLSYGVFKASVELVLLWSKNTALANHYPYLSKYAATEQLMFILILISLFILLTVIAFIRGDTTTMRKHPRPIEKKIPVIEFKQKLLSFCKTLKNNLIKIDEETNWSMEVFTPLDAEVEIRETKRSTRKITDLLNAIKRDKKSRTFLVLGDPGSGKSVALRKLSIDLIDEVAETDRIPIYVNLREWTVEKAWSDYNPPTVSDLHNFIIEHIKSSGNVFSSDFVDYYFDKLFEGGYLFFILDSFDEIPQVLDVNESSWLIDKLSEVIYDFLHSGIYTRGILSSRFYRRPAEKYQAETILEIRPFTEVKIIENMKKSLYFDKKLIDKLFKERRELIPVARNPFTAALILNYAKDHNNDLPANQADLYSTYINKRLMLKSCQERITKKKLSIEQIIKCASEISLLMFEVPTYGLEAPMEKLKESLQSYPVGEILDVLTFGRLGRVGQGNDRNFSFAHRRFNEYFLISNFLDNPSHVPEDAIPTDSRWRDALALYCEVGDEKEVQKIADFCWLEIKTVIENKIKRNQPQYMRAIHCLRFLNDAFHVRKHLVSSFRGRLSDFILLQLSTHTDLLSKKLAVELAGLLDDTEIDAIVIRAFEVENRWISETALRACRHLPNLSKNLENRLLDYIKNFSFQDLIPLKKELLFSLSLSVGFAKIKKLFVLRIAEYYAGIGIIILLAAGYFPLSLMIIAIALVAVFVITLYRIIKSSQLTFHENFREAFGLLSICTSIQLLLSHIFGKYGTKNLISEKLNDYFSTIHFAGLIEPAGIFNKISLLNNINFTVLSFVLSYIIIRPIYFWKLIKEIPRISSIILYTVGLTVLYVYFTRLNLFIPYDTGVYYRITSITIIAILSIFFMFRLNIIELIKDSLILRKSMFHNNIAREEIAVYLKRLKTTIGRAQFVKTLKNRNIEFTGVWPDGIMPDKNDEASILLAQLEEKQLKLDR
ncbi:MAG: NACHT domain-containing protein [Nitrospirae bacterium]|nr:NACHT domain-containing protein [Nitrospirota bacterium]MBF0534622.1 NACHT domain-containing protein [Nitrospirota bacterium]MBF0616334.1 NACHT domain-containing protein [Nitrospirota bacterium]